MDSKARYNALSGIIKALAHPSRLMMVDELSHGRRCVCELTAMIGADTSTVSKHLSVLKNAGLVIDEKQGTAVYYELQAPCVMGFLGCIENILKTNAERQLELADMNR